MDDGFSTIRFQGVQCSAEGRLWSEGQESRRREFSSFKVEGVWSRNAFVHKAIFSGDKIPIMQHNQFLGL